MDERFLKDEGAEIFTGNELLLKGALESEVSLITGYPGSPVSELFDACHANRELLKTHGIVAQIANNEALAAARLNGSRMAGVRAMAVMKSVGLHVAADALALGNLSEPNNEGGALVVVGDDPGIESTQINNDSRYLSQHLHMPVLEPATYQEIKDWIEPGFELSSQANLYLTYLVTTPQADGGGTVWTRPNRYPRINAHSRVTLDTARIDLDRNVLLPPRTWTREATLPARFERLLSLTRQRPLNSLLHPHPGGEKSIGFVAAGMAYCYLEHALAETGLSGRFPILKLGLTYPVDPEVVLALAAQVSEIVVVEEKRGFIESQVVQILAERANPPKVWGKKLPNGQEGFPERRGLDPTQVMEKLFAYPLLPSEGWEKDGMRAALTPTLSQSPNVRRPGEGVIPLPVLPTRTPTFCPGCPHRDSSSVFLELKRDFSDAAYMARRHGRAPIDLVFHGETGCFTMLMFEPNAALMHNYSGMGLGGGTGAGADPFIANKQIVFLGDSTFFHSGLIAISDSLKHGQDITYVILDNKTTAMTGHQPTPANETDLLGNSTYTQNIEAIVQALAGQNAPVARINPQAHQAYRQLLEETVLREGVKIVIADKECGLTVQRRQRQDEKKRLRRDGFLREERHINITPEVCDYCLECTRLTGCPGLAVEETPLGPKITTDLGACVADGACAQVKVCPSFEEVVVRRSRSGRHPGESRGPRDAMARDSGVRRKDDQGKTAQDPFYILLAGVGGMGAGLLTEILVRAGQASGFRVLFVDKKGLAVRHGTVTSQVVFSRQGGVLSPIIPQGQADLLLGLDLLEAARCAQPSERTHTVIDTAPHATVAMLLGRDREGWRLAEERLKAVFPEKRRRLLDASALSMERFGERIYANLILLGVAFQRGVLPLSEETLKEAIRHASPADDRQNNAIAFDLGRAWASGASVSPQSSPPIGFKARLEEKTQRLKRRYGSKAAQGYRCAVQETVLRLNLDEPLSGDLAFRAYEVVRADGLRALQSYLRLVERTAERDRASWGLQATRAVIQNAFHVMAIKDEIYVAELLTSEEKRERDYARYRIDPTRGDRLIYRHYNRPEIRLGRWQWRPDLVTRDWQLALVKRMGWLRRLWPGWHRQETEFRDAYLRVVAGFEAPDERAYQVWLNILRAPEEVRGYREIRYEKMKAAQQKMKLPSKQRPLPTLREGDDLRAVR